MGDSQLLAAREGIA